MTISHSLIPDLSLKGVTNISPQHALRQNNWDPRLSLQRFKLLAYHPGDRPKSQHLAGATGRSNVSMKVINPSKTCFSPAKECEKTSQFSTKVKVSTSGRLHGRHKLSKKGGQGKRRNHIQWVSLRHTCRCNTWAIDRTTKNIDKCSSLILTVHTHAYIVTC